MGMNLPNHLCGPKALYRRKRAAYAKKYQLPKSHLDRFLTPQFIDQLDACKNPAARRILLGVRPNRME
jgi:hypothetical protein